MIGQIGLYDRPGTVKSLTAPLKLKTSRHRIGDRVRPIQGVGPVRIQIDPNPPCRSIAFSH